MQPSHRKVNFAAKQKKGRRKVQEREQNFRLLFENMEEGFALHDIIQDESGRVVDFRFVNANLAYENHTGMKREAMIEHNI